MKLSILWLLIALFRTTHHLKQVATRYPDPTMEMFARMATAVSQTVMLMLFLGLANHLSYRYTWIWMVAFCSCLLKLSHQHLEMTADVDSNYDSTAHHPTVCY